MLIYAASDLRDHEKTIRKRLSGMMTLAELGTATVSEELVWFSRGYATLCVRSSGILSFRDPDCAEPIVTTIQSIPRGTFPVSQLWALRCAQQAYALINHALDTEPRNPGPAGGDELWARPYAAMRAAAALSNLSEPSMVLQAAFFEQPAYAYVHSEDADFLELPTSTIDKLFAPMGKACMIRANVLNSGMTISIGPALWEEDFDHDPVSTIRHLNACGLAQEQLTLTCHAPSNA